MKECFYFPTWEEQKDVMISLDESFAILDYTRFLNLYSESSSNIDTIRTIERYYKGERLSVSEMDVVQSLKDSTLSTEIKDGCERAKSYVVNKYKIYQSTPSDPIKQKLSELTGAKWYGDYVVLDTKTLNFPSRSIVITSGDICAKAKHTGLLCSYVEKYILMNLDIEQPKDFFPFNIEDEIQKMEKNKLHVERGFNKLSKKRKIEVALEQSGGFYYIIGNIFEEYSLFLQGKENKWEEVRNVLSV